MHVHAMTVHQPCISGAEHDCGYTRQCLSMIPVLMLLVALLADAAL
jgi:hypothetical protein